MQDQERLSHRTQASPAGSAGVRPAPDTMLALQTEKLQTRARIMSLEEQLATNLAEQTALAGKVRQAEARGDELRSQLSVLEERRDSLEALEVAAIRLLGTRDQQEAIAILMEIVAALVGSEEMAIYEVDHGARRLKLAASFGVASPEVVPLGDGITGRVAATGTEYIAEAPAVQAGAATDEQISVCAPLMRQGVTAGVLTIYGLLPQKQRIDSKDLVIIHFIQQQAAGILFRQEQRA